MLAHMPDFTLEQHHALRLGIDVKLVCGVDEAGRGPWAGPVCAAAVILDPDNMPDGIDDSKSLSPSAREQAYEQIIAKARAYGIAMVGPSQIDQINILQATYLAMQQSIAALQLLPSLVMIDGNRAPALLCPSVTIIKGDALSLSIGAASVLAKVARDRLMLEADALYPNYGFGRHKGYGVPEHSQALARFGPCPIHRMSFKPVAVHLGQSQSVF